MRSENAKRTKSEKMENTEYPDQDPILRFNEERIFIHYVEDSSYCMEEKTIYNRLFFLVFSSLNGDSRELFILDYS